MGLTSSFCIFLPPPIEPGIRQAAKQLVVGSATQETNKQQKNNNNNNNNNNNTKTQKKITGRAAVQAATPILFFVCARDSHTTSQ